MDRLTYFCDDGCGGGEYRVNEHCTEYAGESVERLAKYEDTGLTPEEIGVIKSIVGRLATADYPHNFQREREDIVAFRVDILEPLRLQNVGDGLQVVKEFANSSGVQYFSRYKSGTCVMVNADGTPYTGGGY